jgi:hypothetical protein
MNAIAALYADQALRLAHERQAGYLSEAEAFRLAASHQPGRSRLAGIRASIDRIRSAFSAVEPVQAGLPKLSDYPYRG